MCSQASAQGSGLSVGLDGDSLRESPRAARSDRAALERAGEELMWGAAAPLEGGSETDADRAPEGSDEPEEGGEIRGAEPVSLPSETGSEQSAARPEVLSLPAAEGSLSGMGEQFSVALSSGSGAFGVPLASPPGRGPTPSLSLAYSASGGDGLAGLGWTVSVPFIGRMTDRGTPRYEDEAGYHLTEDRFFFSGGQELVPVSESAARASDCAGRSSDCAWVPAELTGWQQYRARVEGGYQRFFRSPDSRRWVVQSPDGARLDFGALPTGEGPSDLHSERSLWSEESGGEGRLWRWGLTRMSDTHGSVLYVRYREEGAQRYVEDMTYTSPLSCAAGTVAQQRQCSAPLSSYGSRVRFVYERRPDIRVSYQSGWEVRSPLRLRRVEMTSATGGEGTRALVVRYHLTYDDSRHHSLLRTVQMEGRPQAFDASLGVMVASAPVAESSLGDAMVGEVLPALQLEYTEQPYGGDEVEGFGGLGSRVRVSGASPRVSLSSRDADLFDVNSDGLVDVLDTSGGRAVVYWNGFRGVSAEPAGVAGTFSDGVPVEVSSRRELFTLSNALTVPMDADGDGRSDLVRMGADRPEDWGYFVVGRNGSSSVRPSAQGWRFVWVGPGSVVPSADPRLGRLSTVRDQVRALDVDGDSLVDLVRSTADRLEVYRNLGWVPGGEGRFGSARVVVERGVERWALSESPTEMCLPVGVRPLDLSDAHVQLADFNGDGLTDIGLLDSRAERRLVYWPSRGNGSFGTRACIGAGLVSGAFIEMAGAPSYLELPELSESELSDVNADGLTDLVRVSAGSIRVWFNADGVRFSEPVRIDAPARLFDDVRLVDIDGSGTTDVLYGRAGRYEWVDLMDGLRPRVLVRALGALGGSSEIVYSTSAVDYLRDLSEADRGTGGERFTWSSPEPVSECDQWLRDRSGQCVHRASGSPVMSMVVRESRTSDRLERVGGRGTTVVTRYAYHDAYYEGIEREMRGFRVADSESVGDVHHPSSRARSYHYQGRRPARIATDRLADNPYEALKGFVYQTEVMDTNGVYLSTSHSSVRVRHLIRGLDGRWVTSAHVTQSDALTYDTMPFVAGSGTVTLPSIEVEEAGAVSSVAGPHEVVLRGARYAHVRSTTDSVDGLGHALLSTSWGRIRGEDGETGASLPDERIESHSELVNVPGSESGWMWRGTRSWVSGHGSSTHLGELEHGYDAQGNEVWARAYWSAPVAYEFAGDADGALGYTQPTSGVVESSIARDSWGRAISSCAGSIDPSSSACLRTGSQTFDTHYGRYVVSESIAVERTGGTTRMLTTTGVFEHSTGLMLSVTGPTGQTGEMRYDGLGRATASIPPPVAGCPEGRPSARITYEVTSDPENQPLSRIITVSERACTGALGADAATGIAYISGGGAVRAALSSGDSVHPWVRGGLTEVSVRGTAWRSYDVGYYDGSDTDVAAVLATPGAAVPRTEVEHDAFGRAIATTDARGEVSRVYYHPLSTEAWDPLDLSAQWPHAGTPSITRVDGHGRTLEVLEQNAQPDVGGVTVMRLSSEYRADGAVLSVQRAQVTSTAPRAAVDGGRSLRRTFVYDTAGRRLGSTDADTDRRGVTAAQRGWRYLFNAIGDLVAVRDPRGCGQNFFYDMGGRLVGEQYVSCAEAQRHEAPVSSVPVGAIGMSVLSSAVPVDVRLHYDSYSGTWASSPSSMEDYPTSDVLSAPEGLLVASEDRAQRSVVVYDRRSQPVWSARQISVIPARHALSATLADSASGPAAGASDGLVGTVSVLFDEANTHTATTAYDHAGRGRALVLPRDPAVSGVRIAGRLSFDARGLPQQAVMRVVQGGSTPVATDGALSFGGGASIQERAVVAGVDYDHRALPTEVRYGLDGLVSTFGYDEGGAPTHMRTVRTPTVVGGTDQPLEGVSVVADQTFIWDAARNLSAILDGRIASEWPAGHRPQSVALQYDALYHVVDAQFSYAQFDGGATSWGADEVSDWRAAQAATRAHDPMRQEPADRVSLPPADRVSSLTWAYDWLANMTEWTDGDHDFYERSIGDISNGADYAEGRGYGSDAPPALRPSALYIAADLGGPSASDRGGYVNLTYGNGGNVIAMTVHGQCSDRTAPTVCADPGGVNISGRVSALRTRCLCEVEQHYQYRWDELNRLAEARRFDRSGGDINSSYTLGVRQRYRYDGANRRVIEEVHTHDAASMGPPDRIALSVIPGDFERRGLTRSSTTYEVSPGLGTETQYLVAGARIVWQAGSPTPITPGDVDRNHRITLAVGDLIQTTSAVIDLVSGELVETSTYYPNGARETYRTTSDAPIATEPAGFTGKEADEEVGVVYFGERYLIPRIARWASPDPLAIHAMGGGEAMNAFHYVAGNLFQGRDPIGLCDAVGQNNDGTTMCADGSNASVAHADIAAQVDAGACLGCSDPAPSATPSAVGRDYRGGRWARNPMAEAAADARAAGFVPGFLSMPLAAIGAVYDVATLNLLPMAAAVLDGAVAREIEGDSWRRTSEFDEAAEGLLEVSSLPLAEGVSALGGRPRSGPSLGSTGASGQSAMGTSLSAAELGTADTQAAIRVALQSGCDFRNGCVNIAIATRENILARTAGYPGTTTPAANPGGLGVPIPDAVMRQRLAIGPRATTVGIDLGRSTADSLTDAIIASRQTTPGTTGFISVRGGAGDGHTFNFTSAASGVTFTDATGVVGGGRSVTSPFALESHVRSALGIGAREAVHAWIVF